MVENIPDMEKIAQEEELRRHIEEAMKHVAAREGDLPNQTADAAGEVGLVRELWSATKERRGKMLGALWKDAKAVIAGGLAGIPLVGEAGTLANLGKVVKAGKDVVGVEKAARGGVLVRNVAMAESLKDATKIIRQRKEAWKTLGKSVMGVPENPVNRFLKHPIGSVVEAGKSYYDVGKKAVTAKTADELAAFVVARGVAAKKSIDAGKNIGLVVAHKVLREIDPFPDVPTALVSIAGAADLVIPGVNILPALWQLGHSSAQYTKEYVGMLGDVKDVVMGRLNKKLTGIKSPEAARSAAAFPLPASA